MAGYKKGKGGGKIKSHSCKMKSQVKAAASAAKKKQEGK